MEDLELDRIHGPAMLNSMLPDTQGAIRSLMENPNQPRPRFPRDYDPCPSCSYKASYEVLKSQYETLFTSINNDQFKHSQTVQNKRHHHDEKLIFCCLLPGNKCWAIVVRGDGRLGTMLVRDLAPYPISL